MEVTQLFMQRVKPAVWDRIVTLLIQTAELEEIGEGQRGEQLKSWIAGMFHGKPPVDCENNQDRLDCFHSGEPMVIEGITYFRVGELQSWIGRNVGEKITTPNLCTRLREIGCRPHLLSVRDGEKVASIRTWIVDPESLN